MRWPGFDHGPIYALVQELQQHPIAALEVLTALPDHLAGHSSVLETQMERSGSIDNLSPAPAHRQHLVSTVASAAPSSPPALLLVPILAPMTRTNPSLTSNLSACFADWPMRRK